MNHQRDGMDSAKTAMRLLIRAANQDKNLLADTDWQGAMMHLNRMIGKTGVEVVSRPVKPAVKAGVNEMVGRF